MSTAKGKSALRVIIDGSMARGGGGFTYLVNVIPTLVRLAPQHQFLLIVNNDRIADALANAPNLKVLRSAHTGYFSSLRSILWGGSRLAASWNADIYFSVAEQTPLWVPCPVIAAFRNLTVFMAVDGGWPVKQRVRLGIIRRLATAAAKTCDRIIFVSEHSADFIGSQLSIPAAKRIVIHHGINIRSWRSNVEKPTALDRYILSVGSVYRYKNYVPLILGWAELCSHRSDTPDLVIIGDNQDPEYFSEMIRAKEVCGALSSRIHFLGEVPYADIIRWYRYASVFVFPSYLETFGHPLLEAMASEVPLVAADIPVFREIADEAALFAAPDDPSAFADRMEQVLYSDNVRARLVEKGLDRIKRFSWSQTAEKLLALFEETA